MNLFLGSTNVVPQHRHHHHHHQKRGYHIAAATTQAQPIANHENIPYYDAQVRIEFNLRHQSHALHMEISFFLFSIFNKSQNHGII